MSGAGFDSSTSSEEVLHEVRNARDVEILLEFVLLGGGSYGVAQACIARVQGRRKGTDERQVLRLDPVAPPFLQLFTIVSLLVSRQECGNELVATLADLASRRANRSSISAGHAVPRTVESPEA